MPEPVVTVEQGKLLGKVSTNIQGGNFYSFQGIPYAKPPVGNLRFKAPLPPESWSGTRDATKEGNQCYTRHQLFKNIIVGSEDCLFLNVYTPEITNNSPLKPVMVWIHGGAYVEGSGSTELYGPEYLLTEDIVLVTINYRLGILGFLSFDDESLGVPGNAGLKDMVLALKWVQKNIRHFAGDPNNVTIFGESAGASSVHYLMLSPLTKGLFHKVIAQSGCALNIFARGKNLSSELAKVLGLQTTDEKEILQKLLALPIEQLFELSGKVHELSETLTTVGGKRTYAPVVEKPSDGAFITEDPIKIINSGNYNQVPIIFGYTTREGMLIEAKIRPRQPTMPRDFETLVPFVLGVEHGSEASKSIADKMKQFYYGKKGSEDDVDNFYLIHTDNYFLREIICSVNHHAATSSHPVYLYRMSVETSLNLYKNFAKITAPGVSHGDDIGYLFKTINSPPLEPNSLEEVSVKRFVKLWTNFAKHGNPNFENKANDSWKPVTKSVLNFIDIGKELTYGTNPESERIKFWNEIFKTTNPVYALFE